MKIEYMIVPLLCATAAAGAQDAARPESPGPAPAEDRALIRDTSPATGPKRRQGADVRRCLDQKSQQAIIRCAEAGRKP
jgi:hypothetical protein